MKRYKKIQAGAEPGQAQLKLGLDFTLTFCRFGLVELVCRISFFGLIGKIWFTMLGSVYIWFFTFQTFCEKDLILQIWFEIFDSIDLVWYIWFAKLGLVAR